MMCFIIRKLLHTTVHGLIVLDSDFSKAEKNSSKDRIHLSSAIYPPAEIY